MEHAAEIAKGIAENPAAWLLTLALVALGYLYRARDLDRKAFDERIDRVNEAHKATLEKVLPVAEKLADGITTLERLMLVVK